MKRKEVEDVMGGPGAWDNVDQTDGSGHLYPNDVQCGCYSELMHEIAQCKEEKCEGSRAFFYQVQIRSADEPMTTFYKVKILLLCILTPL